MKTLATPAGFDEQYRILGSLAETVTNLQLWTKVVPAFMDGKTDGERPLFQGATGRAVANEDVIPGSPFTIFVAKVGQARLPLRIFQKFLQIATPAVVVFLVIEVDHRMALHVRLSGKKEDTNHFRLFRAWRIGGHRV